MKLEENQQGRYNHRIALYSLGGVGKTQLALAYAYKYKDRYTHIFWIEASSQEQLLEGFGEIERHTNCVTNPFVRSHPTRIAQAVLEWLRNQSNWLLIIDGLNDIKMIDGLLPRLDCFGHTLITTRDSHCDGIPANGLEVLPMEPEESTSFLLQRAGFNW